MCIFKRKDFTHTSIINHCDITDEELRGFFTYKQVATTPLQWAKRRAIGTKEREGRGQ
jgi:hypothetical protein